MVALKPYWSSSFLDLFFYSLPISAINSIFLDPNQNLLVVSSALQFFFLPPLPTAKLSAESQWHYLFTVCLFWLFFFTLLVYSTGLPAILLWFKNLSSSNWLLPDFQINIFQAQLWYCYSVVKIFQWLSFASSVKPRLAFLPQPMLSVFTPTLPNLAHLPSCNCVLDILYPLWKTPSSSSYMWPFSTPKAITEAT